MNPAPFQVLAVRLRCDVHERCQDTGGLCSSKVACHARHRTSSKLGLSETGSISERVTDAFSCDELFAVESLKGRLNRVECDLPWLPNLAMDLFGIGFAGAPKVL